MLTVFAFLLIKKKTLNLQEWHSKGTKLALNVEQKKF